MHPHTLFSHQVTPHTYHKHQYSYILLTNSWIPKLPKGDYRSQRVINSEATRTWEMWFHSHTYMHLKPFNFKRPLALFGVQGNENRKHRVQFSKFTTHVNELYNTYHISLHWSLCDEAKNWYGSCCIPNGAHPMANLLLGNNRGLREWMIINGH